jgi:hypothetical protein
MADRLPIVSVAGEKKELPAADTIAQSKINGLVSALALKAPLAAPDFTGDVTFDTDVLVVDSVNNRVGVGTTSPSSALDVSGDIFARGSAATLCDASFFIGNGSEEKQWGISTTTNGQPGSNTGTDLKIERYDDSGTLVNTALTILRSNGRIGIGNTPAVELDVTGEIRASTGILFGTDTAAANALDDYEEGTWTPALVSTGASFTYPRGQYGSYTKVGDLVTVQFYIGADATGTLTNLCLLSGLPFTTNSSSLMQFKASAWVSNATPIAIVNEASTTSCTIWEDNNGTTTANASTVQGGYIVGHLQYKVA